MTRRRRILAILGGLAVVLVLGWWGTRELIYSRHLPPAVKERMPAHWRIPWGLKPEVRRGIDDLYSNNESCRIVAVNRLGNFGPDAAAAAPYLVALLADGERPQDAVESPPPPATSLIDRILNSVWPAQPQAEVAYPLVTFYWPPSYDVATYSLIDIGELAVEPCIAALKDPDPTVRFCIVKVLGLIGDRRATLPLIAVLQEDRIPAVRARAAEALGFIGGPEAVAALGKDLTVTHACPEEVVMKALGRTGDPQAVLPLTEGLASCYSNSTAACCYEALLRCGEPGIRAVLDNMSEPDAFSPREPNCLVHAIVDGAYRTEDPRLIRILLKGLEKDWAPYGYVESLKMLKPSSAVEPLLAMLGRPDLEPIYDEANRRYDFVVDTLGTFDDPRIAGALLASLNRPDPHPTRRAVALALANLNDPRAVPLLAAEYDASPSDNGAKLAEALGRFDTEESTLALLRMLECADKEVFRRAAMALRDRRDPRAAPLIAASLEWWVQTDQGQRWPDPVQGVLVAIGRPAIVHLLPLLGSGKEMVRARAADILGLIGDRRAFDALLNVLNNDPEPFVRAAAAEALSQLRDLRAREPLAQAMDSDPDYHVRMAAARGLGCLRDPRANDILWARYLAETAADGNPFRETLASSPLGEACLGALATAADPRGLKAFEIQFRPYAGMGSAYLVMETLPPPPESIEPLAQAIRDNPGSLTIAPNAAADLFIADDPAAERAAWDATAPYPWLRTFAIAVENPWDPDQGRRIVLLLAHKDPDRFNRLEALWSLACSGDPPARRVVEEAAANDPSRIVRHFARYWLLKWDVKDPGGRILATTRTFSWYYSDDSAFNFGAPKWWQPDPPPPPPETAP
jgi:HEAT repeat protein